MLCAPSTEEHEHARRELRFYLSLHSLEQRQPDRRREASTAAKSGLVHSNPIANRKAGTRSCPVYLAIDSKLRGCDVVALRVEDVAPNGYALDRATVRQKKTGRPVKFELTDQTRQAVDDFLKADGKKRGEYLFNGRRGPSQPMTTRQYARLLGDWMASIGLDPKVFGTHSLRRTKATLIYRRIGNLRAVQLLLGHTKIESTVRYLGIEVGALDRRAS